MAKCAAILAEWTFCVQAHLSEDRRFLRIGAFGLVNVLLLGPETLYQVLTKLRARLTSLGMH